MFAYIYNAFVHLFQDGIQMYPIFILIIVGCIVQLIKVVTDLVKYKRFLWDHVFTSGGFPSFHSGLASSVTMLVLLKYGFNDVLLAVAFAFAILFAYDAMNLRYEAGQHAHYINKLRAQFTDATTPPPNKKNQLKERIGHTPFEVLGGIVVGSVLTFLLYYRFIIL